MIEVYVDKLKELSALFQALEAPLSFVGCAFLAINLGIDKAFCIIIALIGAVIIYFLHLRFFPKRIELYIRIHDDYMEVLDSASSKYTVIPFASIYYLDYITKTEYSIPDDDREFIEEVIVGIDVSWKGNGSSGIIEIKGNMIDMSYEQLMDIIISHTTPLEQRLAGAR